MLNYRKLIGSSIIISAVIILSCKSKTTETQRSLEQDTSIVNSESFTDGSTGDESSPDNQYDNVFNDWRDGKWIDDKFLEKLKSTRSLDSAIAVNRLPILSFNTPNEEKTLQRHSFYTYLQADERTCSIPITNFTGGSAQEEFVAIFKPVETACRNSDYLKAEKISPEDEDREYLDVSFRRNTDDEETDDEIESGRYRRIRIELVWVINADIISGVYENADGDQYVFQRDHEADEFVEGFFENELIFATRWKGEKFNYKLDLQSENTILLYLSKSGSDHQKTFTVVSNNDGIELRESGGTEVLKLMRKADAPSD